MADMLGLFKSGFEKRVEELIPQILRATDGYFIPAGFLTEPPPHTPLHEAMGRLEAEKKIRISYLKDGWECWVPVGQTPHGAI